MSPFVVFVVVGAVLMMIALRYAYHAIVNYFDGLFNWKDDFS